MDVKIASSSPIFNRRLLAMTGTWLFATGPKGRGMPGYQNNKAGELLSCLIIDI